MQKAFTLIEVLVVIGLLGLILAWGFFLGLDVYRGYEFRSEFEKIIATLQQARSQALSNIDNQPHTVHLQSSQLKFTGSTIMDVTFQPLSAQATSGIIKLSDSNSNHALIISINPAGQITW